MSLNENKKRIKKKEPLEHPTLCYISKTVCPQPAHPLQQEQWKNFGVYFLTPHGNMLPYVSATQLPAKGYLRVIIPKLESRRLHCTTVCLPKVFRIKLPRWLNYYLKHNYVVFRWGEFQLAPLPPPDNRTSTVSFLFFSPPTVLLTVPFFFFSFAFSFPADRDVEAESQLCWSHSRQQGRGFEQETWGSVLCKARLCNPEDFQPLHWSDIPSETERYKLFPEPYKAGLVPQATLCRFWILRPLRWKYVAHRPCRGTSWTPSGVIDQF